MQIYGSKKGQGKQRQPVIAPDSAQSKTFISIMYGLGEGEMAGLANSYKSVYLEGTPLQNDNGEFNFPSVKVDFRTGTNDQEYIDGFPDVASETAVNVELKHGTPYIKAFNNLDLDALRVRLKWGALRSQNRENGDVSGVKIDYAIDVKTDNGGWVEALNTSINAKTSDAYERSHRIDLPKAGTGWQLRVRRITPNSTSDFVSDKMYVSAITEVIDLKLRYPNTALLGLRYDASSFGSIAKMSARCRGLIIKVPTNYDTVTRTYTGMWDGQFKMAYSNNPAWVYYDLCTAERYGLGGRLTGSMIDKWSLYRLAQYCDEMVDDGMGGTEPRFTVNVYIQSADGAFELLSRLAGVFRAISYWDGNSIVLDADIPQDSIYSFSRANVIDGVFEYTGTRSRDRRTVAKVAWDNPANHFKTEYEYVRDEAAIAKFGVRVADIAAWGCTSRGQAQRAGLWALKSEQLETRMVTFKVGLDGLIPAPAKVIEISDELFAGRATGGRVLAINKAKTVITLDRAITAKAGDTLVINGDDGTSQRRQIRSVSGDEITVTKAFGDIGVENVWVLDSTDLATMKFRVLSVTADDNHTFTITAVQYNPVKYDAIDHGAYTPERPISVVSPTVQARTKSVNLSSYHTVNQGVSMTTLVIGWEQVSGAVKYQVEWRKDSGNWQALPPTGTNSIEIAGVYAGQYEARVTAISAFGQASLATHSALTQIQGKVGKPTRPAFIRATGVLFGMNLTWGFGANSADTNYTEIEVSPDGRSNISTLGTFAYPTNKHEITGLQGNLTQYYRARIVDKLGNVSDWTAWMGGTTSADAAKVLDLISGQISENHLDRALRTPISALAEQSNRIFRVESVFDHLQRVQEMQERDMSDVQQYLATEINDKIETMPRTLEVEYYLSTSRTALDGGTWSSQAPQWRAGRYMWSRTKMTLSSGEVQYRPSEQGTCIAGQDGRDGAPGQDGRGIVSITEYYLASVSSSGVHRGMHGWTTSVQQTNAAKPFLWNYEKVTYTSGSPSYTDPVMIGKYSRDGRDGQDGAPGRTGATGPAGRDGATGAPGRAGQDGRGIVSITEYYLASVSSSGVHRGMHGWTTSVQQTNAAKPFLWNYEKVTYTSGSPSYTDPVMIGKYSRDGRDGQDGAPGRTGATGPAGRDGATGAPGRAGQDGRGIVSITEYYLASVSSSGVHRGMHGWTTSVQQTNAAKPFLWNYEKVTYTSGSPSYTDPVMIGKYSRDGRDGQDGAPGRTGATGPAGRDGATGAPGRAGQDGRGIVSITEYYLASVSSSGVHRGMHGWTTSVQQTNAAKPFLWNYEKVTYTSGSPSYTDPVMIGKYGRDGRDGQDGAPGRTGATGPAGRDGATGAPGRAGQDGRGIVSITEYYLASVSSSGVHRGMHGWTTSVQQTNAAKPFLWNYEKVTYTSGSPSYTDPVMIGKYGRDGRDGQDGAPGRTGATGPAGRDGATGAPGRAGQDGRGIVSITEYYLASVSSSGVHRGMHGWTTSVQQTNAAKPFLWNYEKVTYTSGSPSYTDPVMIGKYSRDGRDGQDGAPGRTGATGPAGRAGRGITSVTAQYYLSSSSTRQTGGAWTDRAPTWQFGKYIWTRTKIVYSDRRTNYTTPIVSSEWEGVHRELNNRLEGLPNKLEVQNINVKVGNVLAIRGLKIEHNGVISGFGLMSELQNGRVTSQFGVNADSFYVGSPRDGKKPFATYTQPTVINGVRIPAGTYINTAFIANASITMAQISDSIQSDNYVPGRQGWRLFKDGRFELNNTFGDGSSLELNSKGLIVWYNKAQGRKAVELGIFS
ncbi:TipJ family phage tail tip protein [Moraxella bovoculi]|uniref:TipJ family phage tail tip protein n=1 Tax=Moraxella bovoculi TaxID=386891 RepID=UPI000E5898EA|nr:phage tail protein [Moraxella bovoculi]